MEKTQNQENIQFVQLQMANILFFFYFSIVSALFATRVCSGCISGRLVEPMTMLCVVFWER